MSNVFVATQDTFIDIPNVHSLLIYSHSCPFKCPYCFNIDYLNNLAKTLDTEDLPRLLQILNNLDMVIVEDHEDYLRDIFEMYDAFIFSGGEPLLHFNQLFYAIQFLNNIAVSKYNISDNLIAIQTTAYDFEKIDKLYESAMVNIFQIDIKTNPELLHKFTDMSFKYSTDWINKLVDLSIKTLVDIRTTIPTSEYLNVDKYIDLIDALLTNGRFASYEAKIIKFVNNISTDYDIFTKLSDVLAERFNHAYKVTKTAETFTLVRKDHLLV